MRKLLLIGDNAKIKEFTILLAEKSITAVPSDLKLGEEMARTEGVNGIFFILPVYLELVYNFLVEFRKKPEFDGVKLFFLGDYADSRMVYEMEDLGVHLFTYGPVPEREMVRYIDNALGHY